MTVRVRFFAMLREHAGQAELPWETASEATVDDLWGALCAAFPTFAPVKDRVAFAVNREYVDRFHRLYDNDEVAFIPPVSGGTFHSGTSHVSPHAAPHRSKRGCGRR